MPEPTRKVAVDRGPSAKLRIVWGLSAAGRYLGEVFFREECTEDQRSKFEASMKIVADQGFLKIAKLYRYPLEGQGNLGEFKTFKKRLFFFRDGNDLVITHGATKKTDDTDLNEIERAKRIEQEIKQEELRRAKSAQRGGKP